MSNGVSAKNSFVVPGEGAYELRAELQPPLLPTGSSTSNANRNGSGTSQTSATSSGTFPGPLGLMNATVVAVTSELSSPVDGPNSAASSKSASASNPSEKSAKSKQLVKKLGFVGISRFGGSDGGDHGSGKAGKTPGTPDATEVEKHNSRERELHYILAYNCGDVLYTSSSKNEEPIQTLKFRSTITALAGSNGTKLLVGCANGEVYYYADIGTLSEKGHASGPTSAMATVAGGTVNSSCYNTGGHLDSSRVAGLQWIPGSSSKFAAVHMDGTLFVYDIKQRGGGVGKPSRADGADDWKPTPGMSPESSAHGSTGTQPPGAGLSGSTTSSTASASGNGAAAGSKGASNSGSAAGGAGDAPRSGSHKRVSSTPYQLGECAFNRRGVQDGDGATLPWTQGGIDKPSARPAQIGADVAEGELNDAAFAAVGVHRVRLQESSPAAIGNGPGANQIYSSHTPRGRRTNLIKHIQIGKGGINSAAFSPGGTVALDGNATSSHLALSLRDGAAGSTYLALACRDGFLRIMDFEKEELLVCLRSYYGALLCVAWSHDGKYVATGGEDDLVTIWCPADASIVARLEGHASWVSSVSWDDQLYPGGRYRLASAGQDAKIALWDFAVDSLHLRSHNRHSKSKTSSIGRQQSHNGSKLLGGKLTRGLRGASNAGKGAALGDLHDVASVLPIVQTEALGRAEVPVLEPLVDHVAHSEPLTSATFTPDAVVTACTGGVVRTWWKPPVSSPAPPGSGSVRSESNSNSLDMEVAVQHRAELD